MINDNEIFSLSIIALYNINIIKISTMNWIDYISTISINNGPWLSFMTQSSLNYDQHDKIKFSR